MFRFLPLLILLLLSLSASARVYECKDAQGRRVWTDQPCAGGKVLHDGVSDADQARALSYDAHRRRAAAQSNAEAARRFRAQAYGSGGGYYAPARRGNLQACDIARRSLRIQRSSSRPDASRIAQLEHDVWRYCQ
ncbi:hypothetical protein CK623_00130 [Vandammella animalimorsus]|uniref:DUF4124 domain-containing protein n=1 Tax=Vandammella animalimorsus TaxID=2029117 RepID=A0A2A2AUF5_9BURK|nr:hypothetical protein CK623_00130 [Vandammella animalimorsus]